MFTTPLATEKFVLLNCAIPLALVLALSMVIVLPAPLALAIASAPVKLFRLVTALPVKQLGQVMLPAASMLSGLEALTTTVPVAFGTVIVLFEPLGVPNTKLLVMPELVLVKVVDVPCTSKLWPVEPIVKAPVGVMVFTANTPPMVTVLPLSVIIESPIVCEPVNLGIVLVVPPAVVTPPPVPTQLPAVVQMS